MNTPHTRTHRRRLTLRDHLALGTHGIRSRPGRAALTSAGIAVGLASVIAVFGITSSSRAELADELSRLGTNLLTVEPGDSIFGEQQPLPDDAALRIARIPPVISVSNTTAIPTSIRRTVHTPEDQTNGITVTAADPTTLTTTHATLADGRFIDHDTAHLPVVVLGATAAERLGIRNIATAQPIHIGSRRFRVIGILDPLILNPEIDRTALIGYPIANAALADNLSPTTIYVRIAPEHIDTVRNVLPPTTNPTSPNEVEVSRPSDALQAQAEVDRNLQLLLAGIGGIGVLVGGIGIANVMIISILERRTEIGTRRALGATRNNIRAQFILESTLLSVAGGMTGALLGAATTYIYANHQRWTFHLETTMVGAALAMSLLIGAIAGLVPAGRAARIDPADAVRP